MTDKQVTISFNVVSVTFTTHGTDESKTVPAEKVANSIKHRIDQAIEKVLNEYGVDSDDVNELVVEPSPHCTVVDI